MLRILAFCLAAAILQPVDARSRFVRQTDQIEGSGAPINFINFDEGSANPIVAYDEGSGAQQQYLLMDEEGSGDVLTNEPYNNTLMFDTNDSTKQPVQFEQVINITDTDVESLVIKVNLPSRSTSQLLDELKDDSQQQTNLPNSLDMAVSLTSVLDDILKRIQGSTNSE